MRSVLFGWLFRRAWGYGILCDGLDGKQCTHYHSCSWLDNSCQHNNCLNYNSTLCRAASRCHWTEQCGYCVENCNDDSDCFFSGNCRLNSYCKPSPERTALGCAVMETASPAASDQEAPSEAIPTNTYSPSKSPTLAAPIDAPSNNPTNRPTNSPTVLPSKRPSGMPSASPTHDPTSNPSSSPTPIPTNRPSNSPTKSPTNGPSNRPSNSPTNDPTNGPTFGPLPYPTTVPSSAPSSTPSLAPSNEGGVLRTSGSNTATNASGLGGSVGDSEVALITIIVCSATMVIAATVAAAVVLKMKRRRKHEKIQDDVTIALAVWPIVKDSPNRCRSFTYPHISSPVATGRRRLHTAISLGEFSRGGEPYGSEIDLFIE